VTNFRGRKQRRDGARPMDMNGAIAHQLWVSGVILSIYLGGVWFQHRAWSRLGSHMDELIARMDELIARTDARFAAIRARMDAAHFRPGWCEGSESGETIIQFAPASPKALLEGAFDFLLQSIAATRPPKSSRRRVDDLSGA
jgi:hypothetical protein